MKEGDTSGIVRGVDRLLQYVSITCSVVGSESSHLCLSAYWASFHTFHGLRDGSTNLLVLLGPLALTSPASAKCLGTYPNLVTFLNFSQLFLAFPQVKVPSFIPNLH